MIEKEVNSGQGKAFLFVDKVENGEFTTTKELKINGDISDFNAHSIKIKK